MPVSSNVRPHTTHLCTSPNQVFDVVNNIGPGLIAIDGFQGSGKTTLARELGTLLRRQVITADDYLNKHQGAFFSEIDTEGVRRQIAGAAPCIFEGVCCLQILEAVGESPAALIYVKRMRISGWADERELLENPEHTNTQAHKAESSISQALHTLWREVALYHARYLPHENAQVVYERSAA